MTDGWAQRRRIKGAITLLVLAMACVGCVGPTRTNDGYRGKAATSADAVRSSVETAIVGIEAAHRHGLQAAYVSTLLSEADDDASAVQATLDSIQPPSGHADDVKAGADAVISDAVTALDQVRITARRGQVADLDRAVPRLEHLASSLDRLATTLRDDA